MAAYIPGDRLGEYIHGRYENYKRYGLARKLERQSSPEKSLTKYYYEAKEEASQRIQRQNKSKGLLRQWENNISYLMGHDRVGSVISEKERQILQDEIVQYLQHVCQSLEVSDINWSTMTLNSSGLNKARGAKVDFNKVKQHLGTVSMRTIGTLSHSSLGSSGQGNLKSLQTQLLNIQAIINSLPATTQNISDLQTKLNNIKNRIQSEFGLNIEQTWSGRQDISSFSGDIQELMKDAALAQTVAALNGMLGEKVSQTAAKAMLNGVKQGISEISSSIKGKSVYLQEAFSKGLDVSKIVGKGFSYTDSETGAYWSSNLSTEGKTDVTLKINEQMFKASVKNYNLQNSNPNLKGVTLVSGTNLLYLFSNKARFFNHYLNQTASTALASDAQSANEVMKSITLLTAFSGGGFRESGGSITADNRANVFIINDSSRPGAVRVVSIYDLYEQIIRDESLYDGVKWSLGDNPRWDNNWVGEQSMLSSTSANARITNLLAEVRARKLKVQIEFSTMQRALFNEASSAIR